MLQNYFRSGWAFLIPYLAAYLLYAWLKWPVNPAPGGEGLVKGMSESAGALPSTAWSSPPFTFTLTSLVPPLLHVYWFLHALHLVLGAYALRAWWKGSILNLQLPTSSPTFHAYSRTRTSAEPRDVSKHQQRTGAHSAHLPPALRSSASSEVGSTVYRLLPWLLLALLFYIPGVYLEWPSDPWEHLRRINEWRVLDTVTAHSMWMKSSYFIPYSLLSWCVGLRQIFWLDFYYTGICLLLCWQYYRLARACDLSERAAMVFVLLQALLFGNNIFSFYRYYGISSSIYAQLGAVALTRIVLEAAKHPQLSLRSFFSVPSIVHRLRSSALRQPPTFAERLARTNTGMAEASNGDQPSSAYRSPSSVQPSSVYRPPPTAHPPTVYGLLLTGVPLLALTSFNHLQGLGIAALGFGAVIIWRLVAWKRSVPWWLLAATLIVNVIFLWLYPQPALIDTYRAQGYLNAWLGFNILDLRSPAGDRMLQIVSAFGLVNLAAALFLLRRNHVIGWLTILPLAVLLLPAIAVPLAQVLSHHGGDAYILTFQRMLFSIPPCLALVCHVARQENSLIVVRPPYAHTQGRDFSGVVLVSAVLIALVVAPSSSPSYNRVWHASTAVPNDLRLRDVFAEYEAIQPQLNSPETKVITTQLGTALLSSYASELIGPSRDRLIAQPATDSARRASDFLAYGVTINPLSLVRPTDLESSPTERTNLITNPLASDPTAWIALGGHSPKFATGITGLSAASTALQNPIGETSNVFTVQMIPVQTLKSYRVEMQVRQASSIDAPVYLAVAWYDAKGKSLESNVPEPQGSGYPRGWSNGTYSYFGLVAQPAPTSWSNFGISFGLNETATIPSRARFMRAGALLNSNATPLAAVQITGVRLFEKITPTVGLAIPGATSGYSAASQAAQLSRHWPPNQIMVDRVGTRELQAAGRFAKEPFPVPIE